MTTLEIEIALTEWAHGLVIPRLHGGAFDGLDHECDLLVLSQSNYATEIEIKVSKGDLRKDKQKEHMHQSDMIKYLYFAVPEEMIEFALAKIPKRAGLLAILKKQDSEGYYFVVDVIRKPQRNKICRKWTDAQRYKLAEIGVSRIRTLQRKLYDEKEKHRKHYLINK